MVLEDTLVTFLAVYALEQVNSIFISDIHPELVDFGTIPERLTPANLDPGPIVHRRGHLCLVGQSLRYHCEHLRVRPPAYLIERPDPEVIGIAGLKARVERVIVDYETWGGELFPFSDGSLVPL